MNESKADGGIVKRKGTEKEKEKDNGENSEFQRELKIYDYLLKFGTLIREITEVVQTGNVLPKQMKFRLKFGREKRR